MTRSLRPLALVGAGLIATSLTFGSGVALASPAPAETPALCVSVDAAVKAVNTAKSTLADKVAALTDANSAVTAAESALNLLPAGDPGLGAAQTTLQNDKQAVQDAEVAKNAAQADLTGAKQSKENALSAVADAGINCDTGTTAPPAETTTTPPAKTNTTPPVTEPKPTTLTVADVRAEIDALNCDHFAEKNGKIEDDSFSLIGHSTSQERGALSDAYSAKLHDLNYCVSGYTPAPQSSTVNNGSTEINNGVVVNPTQDDGSKATTSGNEVTDVPSGSIQTGAV